MKKNYITIGGQEYRVEANWNAVVAFLEAVGKDDMAALANMSQLKPSEITALMAACINEGEALDGRECNLTAAEIGRICDVTLITQFLLIYKDQSSLKTPVAEEEKKKRLKTDTLEPKLYIGQVRGWAFGLLHLRRDDFYRMREGEFWEALAAYRQEKEDDRRHSGELVRGAALRLFNLQLAPKDRILKSERFWPMPWDEDEEQANIEEIKRLDSLSDEEMKAEAAKFYKRLEKHTDGNK